MFTNHLRTLYWFSNTVVRNKSVVIQLEQINNAKSRLSFVSVFSNLCLERTFKTNVGISLIKLLSKRLDIAPEECEKAISQHDVDVNVEHAKKILDICEEYKVKSALVVKHLYLLNMSDDTLSNKLHHINSLNLKDINDGISLINTSDTQLQKVFYHRKTFSERLYYIANKISRSPDTIAGTMSKRIFLCTMDAKQLENALDLLLECGISPDNIIKDWWVTRHKLSTIKERLETFKSSGRDKLMPWMVKCSGRIYERAIFISENHVKELKGGQKSQKTYLQDLLKCSSETIDSMCVTFPKLSCVRIFKVKEIHELLMQKGFTNEDIIKAPKIFAHSISTVALRLDQLEKVGIKKVNLKIICNSRKVFHQFLKSVAESNELKVAQ